MGDARGTELLVDSYRTGLGTTPDRDAADLWAGRLEALKPARKKRRAAGKPKKQAGARNRRIATLEAEIAALNRELGATNAAHAAEIDKIMSSKRYQIGDAVVRGLTVPKRLLGRDD